MRLQILARGKSATVELQFPLDTAQPAGPRRSAVLRGPFFLAMRQPLVPRKLGVNTHRRLRHVRGPDHSDSRKCANRYKGCMRKGHRGMPVGVPVMGDTGAADRRWRDAARRSSSGRTIRPAVGTRPRRRLRSSGRRAPPKPTVSALAWTPTWPAASSRLLRGPGARVQKAGKKRVSDEVRLEIVTRTAKESEKNATDWSARMLAEEIRRGRTTVQRVWKEPAPQAARDAHLQAVQRSRSSPRRSSTSSASISTHPTRPGATRSEYRPAALRRQHLPASFAAGLALARSGPFLCLSWASGARR